MFLAAYMVAGFLVASVYAVGMLRGRTDRYQRLGFVIPFVVAAIATPLQIVAGDTAAREVYDKEPVKFASIEMLSRTGTHVPETIGGIYVDGHVRYGLRLPNVASLLAGFSPNTRIRGLNTVPPALRPEPHLVTLVHLSFDVMVFMGFALLGLSAWFAWAWWHRRDLPRSRWFLRLSAIAGVLALIALEAGWVVTEVGRQPWTVVGYLLTRDAVTTRGNLWVMFAAVLVLYAVVGTATVLVLRSMRRRWRAADEQDDVSVPYGPDEEPLEKAVPSAEPR
jgi:cytochrome d ubiquinol oxidase subunit I